VAADVDPVCVPTLAVRLSFFEERIPPFTAGVNPTIPYSHVLLLIRIFM